MKSALNLIKHLLFKNRTCSYSQEGEDIVLARIFNNKKNGFFVDVGAHHPSRFSNTYYFYKNLAWHGINIEPNPDVIRLFNLSRLDDITLNCGVASKEDHLDYFIFDEPALNTFCPENLNERITQTKYKHIDTKKISVLPLSKILDKHLPLGTHIDFISIDVEGLDLDVVKSNNWEKYRPSWLLIEQLNLQDIENLDFEVHHFMKSVGYVLFAKTFNTLFYKDSSI